VDSIAHELAAVLAGRGPDGALIYSDRDVSIAVSLISAIEGGSPGSAARGHFADVCRLAGVAPADPAPVARAKIDRLLDAVPIHPALLAQLKRVMRRVVPSFADPESARAVGAAWAKSAPKSKDLDTARGAVLAFRLQQGRTPR
jgi:hypothetical protein